jgi:hypothetical protein
MARDSEHLRHLLELEYEYAEKAVDKFDEFRARLKSWVLTGATGITAAAFAVRDSRVFWAGVLMVILFAISELSYIDIQEDAAARSRELDALIDALSRGEPGPEHEAYRFGIGKAFDRVGLPHPQRAFRWLTYRTFNPVLYGTVFILMVLGATVAPMPVK